MKNIPLQALHYFYHAADLGSFKAAADALFVTPGAMSQQIRQLEDRLNTKLFERQHRKVVLTKTGEQLLPHVRVAFESLQEGMRQIGDDPDPSQITLSTLPSFGQLWLIPRLGQLKNIAPELSIALVPGNDLIDFNRDSIDLCVRFGGGKYAGLHSELLFPDYLYPVCHPLFLENNPIDRIEDLYDCPLLEDTRPDMYWRDWFESAGVTAPIQRPAMQYDGTHFVIEGALAVQGVALVRHSVVSRFVEQGTLVKLFDHEVESRDKYWLCAPPSHFNREKVKKVAAWLHAEADQFRQEIRFKASTLSGSQRNSDKVSQSK